MPEPPPASSMPTCETAGVLAPIVAVVAAYQAMEAIKICSGNLAAVNPQLDGLRSCGTTKSARSTCKQSRREDCPTCGERQFPWLSGERGAAVTQLCGRNSVQISPAGVEAINLPVLAEKLRTVGDGHGESLSRACWPSTST